MNKLYPLDIKSLTNYDTLDLVFTFSDSNKNEYLGVMVDSDDNEDKYLVSLLDPFVLHNYITSEIDLYKAIKSADLWYLCIDKFNGNYYEISTIYNHFKSIPEEYLPGEGFYN